MSKIIVSEFVTLDGVMEAPGGEPGHPHTGWVFDFIGDEQIQYKLQETLEAESLLIGRVTYESFAGAWPKRSGDFADKLNAMPKHVVSTTLRNPEWHNTIVISRDVVDNITRLKQRVVDDLVVNMVDVGEETGELDTMLYKVADTYDEEVAVLTEGLTKLMEPLLILFLGGAVGFIVIALFLPLIKLIQTLS